MDRIQAIKSVSILYLAIIFMTLVLGCRSEERDLHDYYFPYKDLQDGKVYLYKDVGDGTFAKEFWFIQSEKSEEGYHLNISILNSKGEPIQTLREKVLPDEIKTVATMLVERDAYGDKYPVDVEIQQPYSFNLKIQDTSKALYCTLDWINPIDSLEYTLEKIRYFKGFSTMQIMDKKVETLNITVHTTFKSFDINDGETSSLWPGEERYAKGLGLVYFKRAVNPEFVKELQLTKIYGREEFNRLKNTHL